MKRLRVQNIFSLLLILLTSSFALAEELSLKLSVPVDCDKTQNCFLWQYVDQDPSPKAIDYNCESRSYDGHKGSDFFVPYRDMKKGVNVLAAADGIVLGLRNNMLDRDYRAPRLAYNVADKECGNGVVIRHQGGYETQYCHMKQGSIIVSKGQKIKSGDVLGQVGLSGMTEFPHIHISIRKNGVIVDPFHASSKLDGNCAEPNESLWVNPNDPLLKYHPRDFQELAFHDNVYDKNQHHYGLANSTSFDEDSPNIVLIGMVANVKSGDRLDMLILAPDGSVFAQAKGEAIAKDRAREVKFIGKRRTKAWQKGIYEGRIVIFDKTGKRVASAQTKMKL